MQGCRVLGTGNQGSTNLFLLFVVTVDDRRGGHGSVVQNRGIREERDDRRRERKSADSQRQEKYHERERERETEIERCEFEK